MSYARMGKDSDVYVFMSVSGHLECCGCLLGDRWDFPSTGAMVAHLESHRQVGHRVPDYTVPALWEDDAENWGGDHG